VQLGALERQETGDWDGLSGESIVDDTHDENDDESISNPSQASPGILDSPDPNDRQADNDIRHESDDEACDLVDLASLRRDTIVFKASAVGVVTLLDELLLNAGKHDDVSLAAVLPRLVVDMCCRRMCANINKNDSVERSWKQSWLSCGKKGGDLVQIT
jgi:hypothetical protein